MTSDDKKHLDTPPTSQGVSCDSEDVLSGFDEIESAFDRVSSVADALLDSIRDDSLRGRQRRDSRRKASRKPTTTLQDDEDEDYDYDDNSTLNSDDFSFRNYGNRPHYDDDDDDSLLGDDGESVDGSLVHDMKNLKSVTRAIKEELRKEGEAFQVNVTKSDNGKSYFQKLQAQAEAETPKIENLKIKPTLHVRTNRKQNDSLNGDKKATRSNTVEPPVAQISISSQQPVLFLQQLQTFCTDLLGKNPNIPFLVVNILVWMLFCRLAIASKSYFMSDDGVLAPPLGSAVDMDMDVFEGEPATPLGPEVEVIEY